MAHAHSHLPYEHYLRSCAGLVYHSPLLPLEDMGPEEAALKRQRDAVLEGAHRAGVGTEGLPAVMREGILSLTPLFWL